MKHPIPTPIGEARAKLAASDAGIDPGDPFGIKACVRKGDGIGGTFAQRLARLRTWPPLRRLEAARQLTHADVMALSGCSIKTVNRLATGHYAAVTVGELVAIGHALGVAPSALVTGLDVAVRDPALDLAELEPAERVALMAAARLKREARARNRAKSQLYQSVRPNPGE